MSHATEEAEPRILSSDQIRWLETQPGHWTGRARTRREAADKLRSNGDARSADYCDEIAKQYEAKAGEALASITLHA